MATELSDHQLLDAGDFFRRQRRHVQHGQILSHMRLILRARQRDNPQVHHEAKQNLLHGTAALLRQILHDVTA